MAYKLADLTVGKQQTGEGVMSIARGFAYAGCPSLVISLWKIDDRTSAQVMRGFYHYLSDGEPSMFHLPMPSKIHQKC